MNELTRMLHREDLLWSEAVKVSRQAVTERFVTFPHQIFETVFKELVPKLKNRWQKRNRPLATSINWAMKEFDQVWAVDGSVLELLFLKLESLKHLPVGKLAGKICKVIEVGSQLPVDIWLETKYKRILKRKNNVSYSCEIKYEAKEEVIELEKKLAGKFILATNVLEKKELSSSEILKAYKNQQICAPGCAAD